MRVEELMTTPVITCRSDESLDDAARKMWDFDCGSIVIVNDEGKLVGILTDRDICMGALMNGSSLHRVPIHIAMSRTVHAVTLDATIKEVEHLMMDQQIRRVPVIDASRKPIGMIAVNDLVRDAAAVVTGERRRIKRCPAHDCLWLFYDGSKNLSRRWCAMDDCGTRDKVRRFRARS